VDEYDATSCYVGFEIRLDTNADKERIESAFEFVRDDCTLHILPPHSRIDEYAKLLIDLPDDDCALGEMLIQCGTLTRHELDRALLRQRDLATDLTCVPRKLGEILIEERMVAPRVIEAALAKQSLNRDGDTEDSTRRSKPESHSIRVDSQKLERLIDLIGELIIAGASTNLIAREAALTALTQSTFRLARLVEAVRDQALELRMVQIGATFSRFKRIVRDVARELHKDIVLQISGAETELDKTLIEHMNDPLMHLVRNAIDHGIEDAATRLAQGKNPRATVRLAAYHDSGAVVIEVSDDGGGLNRERIMQKARDRGVLGENDVLTDSEIADLIFEPGFSTAQKITNLSGRGVGLDVVKRNIVALRGTVHVESRYGEGTTVRIRLPLTLAIIDGFQVRVGTASFVIPLDMVEECVALKEGDAVGSQRFANLRGKPLPFVRLRELYSIEGVAAERESIVVVRYADRRAGIVVDELLGELQTVIKPLSRLFKHVNSVGGSTILGNGRVALILDVPSVIRHCVSASSPRTATLVSNVMETGHAILSK
jgi:two-component system chemotaxis sensor kinase CheA